MSLENQPEVPKKKIRTIVSFDFWAKMKLALGSAGIGTEIALHFGDSDPIWKYLTGLATFLSILITIFFEDKDNDGIVDVFENK